jgi:hypothetical protein
MINSKNKHVNPYLLIALTANKGSTKPLDNWSISLVNEEGVKEELLLKSITKIKSNKTNCVK